MGSAFYDKTLQTVCLESLGAAACPLTINNLSSPWSVSLTISWKIDDVEYHPHPEMKGPSLRSGKKKWLDSCQRCPIVESRCVWKVWHFNPSVSSFVLTGILLCCLVWHISVSLTDFWWSSKGVVILCLFRSNFDKPPCSQSLEVEVEAQDWKPLA